MNYYDHEYPRPLEAKGRHQGRLPPGRLRFQLVGQALDADP